MAELKSNRVSKMAPKMHGRFVLQFSAISTGSRGISVKSTRWTYDIMLKVDEILNSALTSLSLVANFYRKYSFPRNHISKEKSTKESQRWFGDEVKCNCK